MELWRRIDVKFKKSDSPSNLIPGGYIDADAGNFMISGILCPHCGQGMVATAFPNGYWINTEEKESVQIKEANTCPSCFAIFGASKSKDEKPNFFELRFDYGFVYCEYIEEMNGAGYLTSERNLFSLRN